MTNNYSRDLTDLSRLMADVAEVERDHFLTLVAEHLEFIATWHGSDGNECQTCVVSDWPCAEYLEAQGLAISWMIQRITDRYEGIG